MGDKDDEDTVMRDEGEVCIRSYNDYYYNFMNVYSLILISLILYNIS
jgi:hypothetical protein